nr:unnamed protein product [Digitaria exilis]
MRGRNDAAQSKRAIVLCCMMNVCLCLLFLYFSGSKGQAGSTAFEYGTKFSRTLGWGSDDGEDGSEESIFGTGDPDHVKPKSFPVCDDRHSELIPCLDRNLIYQMRLKLDLNLMEHYERHCPPRERRFNCLIPPPHGYKVPIKWPKSRDVVWIANIPHTHLAKEKSDQNWMVEAGEKIKFPGGGTHFHHGADKYISNIANVKMHRDGGTGLAPWPARLTTPPPRLSDLYVTADTFEKDTEMWQQRAENYWSLLGPKVKPDAIRNIMDMKANFGSFAAALKEKDVWVMNVVPHDGPSTLKIIYDRGLIGSNHDWCEAFSTYPRTYDLLHSWTVFSDLDKRGCSAEDLLLEMDRILRPTGFIIVRDKSTGIEFIKKYLHALHWEAITVVDAEPSPESEENEMIMIIRKKLWLPDAVSQDSST